MLSQMDAKVKYRNVPTEPAHKDALHGDVFEITDFTTASDWERIIARLEDVIHEWKLPQHVPETKFIKHSFSNGKWKEQNTDIADVPDFEFKVKRLRLSVNEEADASASEAGTSSETDSAAHARKEIRRHALSKTSFSVDQFPPVFEQMLSMENDFPLSTSIHPLARWFGLAEFLVISPSSFNNIDETVTEDRLKVLNSCISIAAFNTQWIPSYDPGLVPATSEQGFRNSIPVFIHFDDLQRHMYLGLSENCGFRTTYEVIDLEKIPETLHTLSGLVDVFKDKIGNEGDNRLIKTSVQLTVKLRPDKVSLDDTSETDAGGLQWKLGQLPFGSMEYDNFLINLHATWPNANADAIEDTLLRSDLDPLQAPKWSAQLVLNDKASQLLTEAVRKFAKQTHREETVQSMLEYLDPITSAAAQQDPAAEEALRRLTGARNGEQLRSRLSKAIYTRLPRYHLEVPIDADSLNEILAYLFPDSDLAREVDKEFPIATEPAEEPPREETTSGFSHGTATRSPFAVQSTTRDAPVHTLMNSSKATRASFSVRRTLSVPFPNVPKYRQLRFVLCVGMFLFLTFFLLFVFEALWDRKTVRTRGSDDRTFFCKALRSVKAAMCDSLPYRLAVAVFYAHERFGGNLGVAYLWQEVMLELRFRWENGFTVPGVQPGPPNQATCLLHQKLQMLNCCIEKRGASPKKQVTFPEGAAVAQVRSFESLVSLDGEDILTDDEDDEFYDCYDDLTGSGNNEEKKTETKPEGRLEAHPTLRLLSDGVTPLYIPVTQEEAPMTEDVVKEHLERLVATEDDEAGRALRTKLQSVALQSDMSAFKAANPGCGFEDFVRWHSPRDWEEAPESPQKGHLSERMAQSDSAWLEAWQNSAVKSVRRQKRLFDERVEAEKVLAFINSSIGDVYRHLLPVFMKAALVKSFSEVDETVITVPHDKPSMIKLLSRLLSDPVFNWPDFERFVGNFSANEQILYVYRSLTNISQRSQHLPDKEIFSAFLKNLVETRQLISVTGGARSPLGQHLATAFSQSSDETAEQLPGKKAALPPVNVKEIILRTVSPRPYPFNRPCVQRLYACLKKDSVRIATAFTDDCLYG